MKQASSTCKDGGLLQANGVDGSAEHELAVLYHIQASAGAAHSPHTTLDQPRQRFKPALVVETAENWWYELCREIRKRGDGRDFIAVDGNEGGSGAAPLVLAGPAPCGSHYKVKRLSQTESVTAQKTALFARKLAGPRFAL